MKEAVEVVRVYSEDREDWEVVVEFLAKFVLKILFS